jgi:hypothetical protein
MAFIKIGNVVINTTYLAAVKLESTTLAGEESVSLLVAIPKFLLLEQDAISPNPYHYEWMDFTGKEAQALRDYFSSFNNVIDLLPSYQEPTAVEQLFRVKH